MAAKSFDLLERLHLNNTEIWEGKRGACVGHFQQIIAGQEPKQVIAITVIVISVVIIATISVLVVIMVIVITYHECYDHRHVCHHRRLIIEISGLGIG